MWGTQDEKYFWCRKSTFDDVAWAEVEAKKPNYLFVPQDGKALDEYECGVKVTEILPVNTVGIVTGQDAESISETEVGARKLAKKHEINLTSIKPILYRPFDLRWIVYDSEVVTRQRIQVMQHMIDGENIGILTKRQCKREFSYVWCTEMMVEGCVFESAYANNTITPLYLYNPPNNGDTQLLGTGKDGRRANLSPAFIAQLGTQLKLRWQSDGAGDGKSTFGPEDVLAYIYAIFHAPSYRARYAEFLKIDFPRVPLTNDASLFWQLAARGRELIDLHLLKDVGAHGGAPSSASNKKGAPPCAPTDTPRGEIAPGFPKYENGKITINKSGEGFADVPEEVWNFHIGGYQVAHKWLKDRKGRTLSDEDAAHYRKVLLALAATIKEMAAIDEIIKTHGDASQSGWPLHGSQEKSTFGEGEVKKYFCQ